MTKEQSNGVNGIQNGGPDKRGHWKPEEKSQLNYGSKSCGCYPNKEDSSVLGRKGNNEKLACLWIPGRNEIQSYESSSSDETDSQYPVGNQGKKAVPADSVRKCLTMSEEENAPKAKHIKLSESIEEKEKDDLGTMSPNFSPLLAIPDDMLLVICKYLDPRDLVNLSRSCERLNAVARYPSLWSKVDVRNHRIMLCQLKEFADYLLPTTKFIASRGCQSFVSESVSRSQNCSSRVLKMITESCPNLEVLILEEHRFDAEKVLLYDFPASLKRLTLKDCEVCSIPTGLELFSYCIGIEDQLRNLQVFVVDGCDWITPSCFLPLGRCPSLTELRMRSCRNLKNGFPYIAIAVKEGFKSLKILDVRGTFMSDASICIMSRIVSLTHLLVEHPSPRNATNADPVKKCAETSKESVGMQVLPVGAACSCPSEDQDICEVKKTLITELFRSCERSYEGFAELLSRTQLPDCFNTERHITDFGVIRLGCDFGIGDLAVFRDDFIPASFDHFKQHLTHLVIKNYEGVTDKSLTFLSEMSRLKYLDVRGTSVTPGGLSSFHTKRADIELKSDYEPDATDVNKHSDDV